MPFLRHNHATHLAWPPMYPLIKKVKITGLGINYFDLVKQGKRGRLFPFDITRTST